ncbi:hypothetical protein MNBD_ALPHA11-1948, partial [hydrothermal vent metagenome]
FGFLSEIDLEYEETSAENKMVVEQI